jgi:hypothetical protein
MVGGGYAAAGAAGNSRGAEATEQRAPHQSDFKETDFKESLIKDITEAVRNHVERKTTAAVDTLWQKGQRAQQQLQQQQLTQMSQLQDQLEACAKGHHQLERENALLRGSLETLMMHLSMTFGAMPQAPAAATQLRNGLGPLSLSPFLSQCGGGTGGHSNIRIPNAGVSDGKKDGAATATTSTSAVPAAAAVAKPEVETCGGDVTSGGDDSEQQQREKASDEVTSSASAKDELEQQATSSPNSMSERFTITLRRADAVPLGLNLMSYSESCLTVEAIRPGGAVDAWNRQCHGDMRQIKPGDSIVAINNVEGNQAMKTECLNKHLLKLVLVRAIASPSTAPPAAAAAVARSLRADADEFVPKPPVQASCKD